MNTSNDRDDSQSRRFVDPDLFRDVIGHFASGVTVITARDQGADFGATASAVTSLSLEPPMLLICLNRKSSTQAAISRARAFAVNILAEDQGEIAAQMARPHPDKFRSLQVSYGELGEPLLTDVLAHLECRVAEEVQGGTHTIFLAEVQNADARAGTPLTYFRGKFGRFQDVADEVVYRQIRQRVLDRDIQLGQLLNIGDLAYALDVPRQAVYYALTKLSAEGLVARNPDGLYAIIPIDLKTVTEAFDARCTIELGVVDLTVGHVSQEEVTQLRRRLEAMKPWVAERRFVDFARFLEANTAYHEYLVGLAKNDALLASFRTLSMQGLITRALGGTTSDELSYDVIEDHVRLTEAFATGDVQAARAAIREHTEHAKRRAQSVLEAAGGEI